jgi:hypothetical protein
MSLPNTAVSPPPAVVARIPLPSAAQDVAVSSCFKTLLDEAIDLYDVTTKRKLLESPFAKHLLDCNSFETAFHVLEAQNQSFKSFREHGKRIREYLAPILRVVMIGLDASAEAAAASVRIFFFSTVFSKANSSKRIMHLVGKPYSSLLVCSFRRANSSFLFPRYLLVFV